MAALFFVSINPNPLSAKDERVPLPVNVASKAYKIEIESIYDADTITCDISLNFGVILDDQKIRLYRINAFEVRGDDKEKGIRAKNRLVELLADKEVYLVPVKFKTRDGYKKGKYGRWLAELYVNGVNINDLLVKEGHAVFVDY
jgi:micrococcal nuclease